MQSALRRQNSKLISPNDLVTNFEINHERKLCATVTMANPAVDDEIPPDGPPKEGGEQEEERGDAPQEPGQAKETNDGDRSS